MGYEIGFDSDWNRDIGYGVPATCDHPGCLKKIDRGLSYVCGGDAYGGVFGCGLFFCSEHLNYYGKKQLKGIITVPLCYRCGHYKQPYKPTADLSEWLTFKLKDKSWALWRKKYPAEVSLIKKQLLLK